jgi:hypothetical protein
LSRSWNNSWKGKIDNKKIITTIWSHEKAIGAQSYVHNSGARSL